MENEIPECPWGMDSHGYQWIFTDIVISADIHFYGHPWTMHACPWTSFEIPKNPWVILRYSFRNHRYPWIRDDYPQIFMDNSWISIDIQYPWMIDKGHHRYYLAGSLLHSTGFCRSKADVGELWWHHTIRPNIRQQKLFFSVSSFLMYL